MTIGFDVTIPSDQPVITGKYISFRVPKNTECNKQGENIISVSNGTVYKLFHLSTPDGKDYIQSGGRYIKDSLMTVMLDVVADGEEGLNRAYVINVDTSYCGGEAFTNKIEWDGSITGISYLYAQEDFQVQPIAYRVYSDDIQLDACYDFSVKVSYIDKELKLDRSEFSEVPGAYFNIYTSYIPEGETEYEDAEIGVFIITQDNFHYNLYGIDLYAPYKGIYFFKIQDEEYPEDTYYVEYFKYTSVKGNFSVCWDNSKITQPDITYDNHKYIRMSENIYCDQEVIGATLCEDPFNTESNSEIQSDQIVSGIGCYGIKSSDKTYIDVIICYRDNAMFSGTAISNKGVYFRTYNNDTISPYIHSIFYNKSNPIHRNLIKTNTSDDYSPYASGEFITNSITWDGNIQGLETAYVDRDGEIEEFPCYRIYGDIIDLQSIDSVVVSIPDGSSFTATNSNFYTFDNVSIIYLEEFSLFVALQDNADTVLEGVKTVFPKKGVYAMKQGSSDYISSISYRTIKHNFCVFLHDILPEVVVDYNDNYEFVKMSDEIISPYEVIDSSVYRDIENVYTVDSNCITSGFRCYSIRNPSITDPSIIIVTASNATYNEKTFQCTGVYFKREKETASNSEVWCPYIFSYNKTKTINKALLTNTSDAKKLETITILQSQIISSDPIKIRFTLEQQSIICNHDNQTIVIDANDIDFGKVPFDSNVGTDDDTIVLVHQSISMRFVLYYDISTGVGEAKILTFNPADKTSAMTQSVGIDSNGKLWTAPGGGGSEIPSITLTSSQIISQNPVTFQFTDSQASIIDGNNPIIYMDLSQLGYGKSVVSNSYDSTSHYLVCDTIAGGPSVSGFLAFAIVCDSTNKTGIFKITQIAPTAKTSSMTQSVGVDTQGRLWTVAGGGSGLNNILDGSQVGSIRTSGSSEEDSTYTIGQYAFAEGYSTQTMGQYSHAEGQSDNTASSKMPQGAMQRFVEQEESTKVGDPTEIFDAWASSEQNHFSLAGGIGSHVEGYNNLALGKYSHAEGQSTKATGESAHTEGVGTRATNQFSRAGGFLAKAEGYGSTAQGIRVSATGRGTSASGYNTENYSGNNAVGDYSFTHGQNANANGFCSVALGDNVKASGNYQLVTGRYNEETDALFVVGDGETESTRYNAFEITKHRITPDADFATKSFSFGASDRKWNTQWKFEKAFDGIDGDENYTRAISYPNVTSKVNFEGFGESYGLMKFTVKNLRQRNKFNLLWWLWKPGTNGYFEKINSAGEVSLWYKLPVGTSYTKIGNFTTESLTINSTNVVSVSDINGISSYAYKFIVDLPDVDDIRDVEFVLSIDGTRNENSFVIREISFDSFELGIDGIKLYDNQISIDEEGTITVPNKIVVDSDPTDAMEVATKQYVDNHGCGSIPTIVIAQSQVTSMSPITIQFTDEQASIINNDNNHLIIFDGTQVGSSTYVLSNVKDSNIRILDNVQSIWDDTNSTGFGTNTIHYNITTKVGICNSILFDPVSKTSEMTQSVGRDMYGKLWVQPELPSSGSVGNILKKTASGVEWASSSSGASNLENGVASQSIKMVSANYAAGSFSFAEGDGTMTEGSASHAEGAATLASSYCAHAEGCETVASGSCSHAEGSNTKASSQYQHVQGKYNVEDEDGVYADIVGNGTSSSASNASALDWDGNLRLKGNVYVGCNSDSSGGTLLNSNPFTSITGYDASKTQILKNIQGTLTWVDET